MKPHITRGLMVATVATGLLAFEVLAGGGRPSVLTALVGLLVSPLIMRADEARKEKHGKHRADQAEGDPDAAP